MLTASGLADLLRPTVDGMGCELLGVERTRGGNGPLIRVYIDTDAGITVDDCERVSRQIGDVLDVEDAIPGNYRLEVSSPGLDRPLFTLEHYQRYLGAEVKMRLRMGIDGRRNLTGRLLGADADRVSIVCDDERFEIPLADIDQTRLVPEWK